MPELQVTIAGATLPGDDGALEARLRARAGDRVTIAGPADDVPRALADAHVLLHCADEEPYGMVLVEALAAGRPVVAPAAGGAREIVPAAPAALPARRRRGGGRGAPRGPGRPRRARRRAPPRRAALRRRASSTRRLEALLP